MEQTHILSGAVDLSILDRVPWMELNHAYGPAIDVPGQVRSLLSPDPDVRRRTIYGFYSNLFHQGTVYPATVASIPIFQHLLRHTQVADKSMILELLVNFAVPASEEQWENVDLAEILGAPADESDPEDHEDGRECYLAVGAGAPLYEMLLGDSDPRVVISAAFALAFFPAHAFTSCPALLALAGNPVHHALARSSALIASSYLGGGSAPALHLQTLRGLIEGAAMDDDHVPLLAATAVYCLLRDKEKVDDEALRLTSEKLAIGCIERGVEWPHCEFYRTRKRDKSAAFTAADIDELYMPAPRFPWGDLTTRIGRHVTYRKPPTQATTKEPQALGPDPASFDVRPNIFERDNVIAAVRRLHAHFWSFRTQGSGPVQEFEPFKPHVMLAWDETLRLLDSDEIEDRWAAARMIEHFGPLSEAAVDQLIERLHRGDNHNLGRIIQKMAISQRQCESLCDRLRSGSFVRSETHSPRDYYRSIVLQHGTLDQIRQLFANGEFKERAAAAQELLSRGEIEPDAVLPVLVEALGSSDYGLMMQARWTFAHWTTAHRWFLESYDTLSESRRWSITQAMSSMQADLSNEEDALFARIGAEKNPALASKLIDVVARFPSPQPSSVGRLVEFCGSATSTLVRWAVVRALGSWTGNDIDPILSERLCALTEDPSPRVRQAAIDGLSKLPDSANQSLAILRRLLTDTDPGNRRHALWHLSRKGALRSEDISKLLLPDQPDRLAAETLLAAALTPHDWVPMDAGDLEFAANHRPLTKSVWHWLSQRKPGLSERS